MKTVTKKQDMESIVKYIKNLSCTESTQEANDGDYDIRLRDDTGTDTDISMYDYKDTKLINELESVYKELNYKEVLIMRK